MFVNQEVLCAKQVKERHKLGDRFCDVVSKMFPSWREMCHFLVDITSARALILPYVVQTFTCHICQLLNVW
jgi:hypothetical protein